jgi:hypothetical protein
VQRRVKSVDRHINFGAVMPLETDTTYGTDKKSPHIAKLFLNFFLMFGCEIQFFKTPRLKKNLDDASMSGYHTIGHTMSEERTSRQNHVFSTW